MNQVSVSDVDRRAIALASGAQVDWFMYYTNDKFDPQIPSSIFLYHLDRGYTARREGPARLP